MAQSFVTDDGVTLIDPGTVVSTQVLAAQGNIAAAGVVTLIGEADEGPGFQDEADLQSVAYTPDQYGVILSKYGSGRLVDSFRAIVAAANDSNIVGAVSLVRMLKTNRSLAAQAAISRSGFGNYSNLMARRKGAPGNLIKYLSAIAVAEMPPLAGPIAYAPLETGTGSFAVRMNGGTKQSVSVTTKMAPDALRAAIEDVNKGILVNGGNQKLVIGAAGLTLTATAPSASQLLVTLQAGSLFQSSPQAGDVAVIPLNGDYGAGQDSSIVGAGSANAASYVVTAVSNSVSSATLTLARISSGSCVAASGTTAADFTDIILYQDLTIKNLTGQDRGSLVGVDGTYNSTINDGLNVAISTPSGKVWAAQPKTGDILRIPATFAAINPGHYQVISATSNSLNAIRLSEGSSGSSTGPQVVSFPVTLANQPIRIMAPVIDGVGKALSIEGSVGSYFRDPITTLDANLSNAQEISASEYSNQMTFSKGNFSESIQSGGDIIIEVGCSQELAVMHVQSDKIDFLVNSVIQFTTPYSQFKTMSDLAAFISSQTSWEAQVSAAKFNNIAPSDLDENSYTVSGISGQLNGRIKRDAVQWGRDMNGSSLIQDSMLAIAGLPEAISPAQFLSNGAKAGSASADMTSAIDALEKLDTNFLVPLISRDAGLDITAGLTESASTYTVDGINAYAKAHVIKMSALESKKNRIALCSKLDSYANVKEAAGELASFRVSLCFQNVKNVGADGTIQIFQPYTAAVIAAGMQAAAGYKGIVKKFANVNGIATPQNDFDPGSLDDRKDALKAGLLFMERVPTGGFRWVSDQMTYDVDNNFVYNSLQAVYVSDLIALSLIDTYDRLVVGKSVAEISASAALSILDSEMFNFKRLRWIATSDDAPKGYKNASARLTGGVMVISAEIKLAGLIYFVPISLAISEVSQTATG